MKINKKNVVYWIFCILIIVIFVGRPLTSHHQKTSESQPTHAKIKHHKRTLTLMRKPINYQKSSELKPYPDLTKVKDFWVEVNLKKNRTYLLDGNKVIYTMYSTGGMYKRDSKTGKLKSMTPTGTFYIQAERGNHFFNQSLNEGANYYVSWLNHGEYLFHSVPTKADGTYNLKEAKKLGKSTGSHGCIRLSIPDAKWMYSHLKVGTKVKIVG